MNIGSPIKGEQVIPLSYKAFGLIQLILSSILYFHSTNYVYQSISTEQVMLFFWACSWRMTRDEPSQSPNFSGSCFLCIPNLLIVIDNIVCFLTYSRTLNIPVLFSKIILPIELHSLYSWVWKNKRFEIGIYFLLLYFLFLLLINEVYMKLITEIVS